MLIDDLIAALRADRRSQVDIAKAAGLSPLHVWRIIHGRARGLRPETLERLAKALGRPVQMAEKKSAKIRIL